MGKNYEIERKFLVEFPDVSLLDIKRRIAIVQTYLKSGSNGSQPDHRYSNSALAAAGAFPEQQIGEYI